MLRYEGEEPEEDDGTPDYVLEGEGCFIRLDAPNVVVHIFQPQGTGDVAVEVIKGGRKHSNCGPINSLYVTEDEGDGPCPCGDEGDEDDD